MRRPLLALLAIAAMGSAPQAADVQLVLRDGRVLEGSDVWREQGNYYLVLEGGGVIPIPEQLVERVALSEAGPPEDTLDTAEEPAGPTGMRSPGPAQLAGTPVQAPRRSEQLEVLGAPSTFQQGVVDPYWHPESDWEADSTDPHRNDFAPSEWADSIVDSEWHPESAFTKDHTQFAPSQWQPDVIDSTWVPEDGFKKGRS